MPMVRIITFEGIDDDTKQDLAAEITGSIVRILDRKPETVNVIYEEHTPNNWATGGKLWSKME